MPKIKFSHRYLKLCDHKGDVCGGEVTLLEVINVNLEDLSDHFKRYDTSYIANDLGARLISHYELPKTGKFMMLILDNPSFGIFTTLRRWTPTKEEYYRESIGKVFTIEFEKPVAVFVGRAVGV